MSDDDAAVLADSPVQADLRGIHSHGVLRVPDYVAKLTVEGVDPRGVPRVARRTGGALVIDCDNSMAQIGGVFAMRQAIDAARTAGVAAAAVGRSNHAGTMNSYVRMAVAEDMIGVATTNALPTMAPGRVAAAAPLAGEDSVDGHAGGANRRPDLSRLFPAARAEIALRGAVVQREPCGITGSRRVGMAHDGDDAGPGQAGEPRVGSGRRGWEKESRYQGDGEKQAYHRQEWEAKERRRYGRIRSSVASGLVTGRNEGHVRVARRASFEGSRSPTEFP